MKKLTIEDMHKIAEKRNGKCLSTKYVNKDTKLEWECAEEHIWSATPGSIKNRGSWCEICSNKFASESKKLTIEEMQKIAEERGGKCLSTEYVNSHTKLEWECAEEHTWFAKPCSIKNSHRWCPHCAKTKKLTIEKMQKIAVERGGKCLSTEYVNSQTKLKWECAEGHTWFARSGNIKNSKSWCPDCATNKYLTIEEIQKIAEERGGKCLSTKYLNQRTKLEFECAEGHTWFATSSSIKNSGSWCRVCSGFNKQTIEEMQKIAVERGGKCLSTEYVNSQTKLKWECAEGHTWFAKPGDIKNGGTWCPKCNFFYSEELCRTTFEQLFGRKFIKCKPNWLVNSLGYRLELDGYCEYHQIAFEYNGEQHYDLSFYSRKKKDLKKIKINDAEKVRICREKGINLFVISFEDDLMNLPELIKNKSLEMGLNVSEIDFDKSIDFNKVYQHRSYLEEMQKIAEERGGKCLSTKYVNSTKALEWECAEGHRWFVNPTSVKHGGHWCSECAGLKPLTINHMQKIAEVRGGKCLSTEYINSKTKLEWECVEGHTWFAKPGEIKNGDTWCPDCATTKRLTIEEMHELAQSNGGKCLSIEYVNSKTKLKWECVKGHTWFAMPGHIKHSGSWCTECSGKKKLTIEKIQKIAVERGGKCLSTEYVNSQTKLKWECAEGHTWFAKPGDIKNGGTWCPHCYKESRKIK